jgi:hypothetical protein
LNHPYIEVEDTAVAVVKFKNGALGNIIVSNSQNPAINVRVLGARRERRVGGRADRRRRDVHRGTHHGNRGSIQRYLDDSRRGKISAAMEGRTRSFSAR